jgi:hypothetical protein
VWAFERRWLACILASFAPEGGAGLSPRAGQVRYLESFDLLYAHGAPLVRIGLRLALWLVVLAPLWLELRPHLLPSFDLDERQRLLGRVIEHDLLPLREAVFSLRLCACLALFANEDLRARSGYDGQVV